MTSKKLPKHMRFINPDGTEVENPEWLIAILENQFNIEWDGKEWKEEG